MAESRNSELKKYLSHTKAIMDSMEMSVRGNPDDVWRYSSYKEYIRKYNDLSCEVAKIYHESNISLVYYDLEKIPSSADTVIFQQKEFFDSVYVNLSILKAHLENELNLKNDEAFNIKNFFQANLRRAVIHAPQTECDIQDVIEQLLIGRGLSKGIDYDRETGRIKISVKEVIPDFILHRLKMALEVKLSKDKDSSKRIVDEINSDIKAYSKQYARQLYIVYDMGSIRDENEFKNDLDNAEEISVIIVKH